MEYVIINIILIVVLLICSFICSTYDMALVSCSKLKIKEYNQKKNNYLSKRMVKFSSNYDNTISTILLTNDLVNVAIEVIGVFLAIEIADVYSLNQSLLVSVFSICSLVIVVIFGEIIPKSIGKIYSFKILKIFTHLINVVYYLFLPITFVVTKFCTLILYPITHNVDDIKISDDELNEMVDEIEEEGIVDEDKAELIRGTIDYANKEAFEVMTPRVNMYAIDINENIENLIKDGEFLKYSRIPVYDDNIDNIVGFIYSKVVIKSILSNKKIKIEDILEKIQFFPRSIEINDIFKEFKKNQTHIAIVLDEYGGVEGLITMEDIIEEIVGEIWDEKDDVENPYKELKDGKYIVDGMMNLDDFFDLFEIDKDDLEETEYVTIGGFCIELLDDRFAKVGDTIKLKNLTLKVIAIDEKNTIEKIIVSIDKKED